MKNYTKTQILDIFNQLVEVPLQVVKSGELSPTNIQTVATVIVQHRGPVRIQIGDKFFSYVASADDVWAILEEMVIDQLYYVIGYVNPHSGKLLIPKLAMVASVKWCEV